MLLVFSTKFNESTTPGYQVVGVQAGLSPRENVGGHTRRSLTEIASRARFTDWPSDLLATLRRQSTLSVDCRRNVHAARRCMVRKLARCCQDGVRPPCCIFKNSKFLQSAGSTQSNCVITPNLVKMGQWYMTGSCTIDPLTIQVMESIKFLEQFKYLWHMLLFAVI